MPKIILLAFPIVFLFFTAGGYYYILWSVLSGLLLMYSLSLFNSHYAADLSSGSIQYQNLLGQAGEIPLTSVTKLEQKRNMAGVLFKPFRVLDLARPTSIGFCDENRDEFEITILTKAYQDKSVFDRLVEGCNKAGNQKFRQYTY